MVLIVFCNGPGCEPLFPENEKEEHKFFCRRPPQREIHNDVLCVPSENKKEVHKLFAGGPHKGKYIVLRTQNTCVFS